MEDKLKNMRSNTNDLSDIVLEKENSGAQKTKKMLLLAASLILLFLIGLVLMKLFSNSSEVKDTSLAQENQTITQKADESADQISQKVEDTNNLFKQEPIIDESSETDLKFEEMVRKLKAQDSGEENVVDKTVENIKTAPEKIVKKANNIVSPVKVTKVKEIAKVISPKVSVKQEKPPVHQKDIKKEVIVSTKVIKTPSHSTKLATLSGYFVQVGATAGSFPDRRFLQKIKNAGYDYVVHSMTIKGRKIKKILVGPYTSRNKAKSNLPSIQAKINPSAYIFRIP